MSNLSAPLLRSLRLVLFALPLLFLAIFYFYPLISIFRISFVDDGQIPLAEIVERVSQPFFGRLLWFTSWQAAASTALTLLLGLPLAYFFAHYHFRGKALLQALLTIPFVMPTVVVAAAFTALIGDRGVINEWLQTLLRLDEPPLQLLRTVWIILLAHAFYNVSVIVRTVGTFWGNLNPRLSEAAAILGASPWRIFWRITLPLLMPSILAASLLVFLFCFTSFGVVLILGGLQFATLEVEIYRQAVSQFNLPVAGFLALVQMALTFVIMAIYTRLQRQMSVTLDVRPAHTAPRRLRTLVERVLIALSLGAVLIVLLSPLLALVWRSFTLGGTPTLQYYEELAINRRQSAFFVTPIIAIRNSLLIAAGTTLLSVTLGLLSAYLLTEPRRWLTAILDPIFLLPLGTSAVTLGFGYIVSMGELRTSLLLMPLAHTLIATPFVVRSMLPALRSLDPRLRESAAVLGATPLRVWWRIDLPLIYPALLVGAIFSFTVSLGEFGATLLISRPDFPTMPMIIYRALSQPGLLNYGQALAMSTLLMAVAASAMVIIERFRLDHGSEF